MLCETTRAHLITHHCSEREFLFPSLKGLSLALTLTKNKLSAYKPIFFWELSQLTKSCKRQSWIKVRFTEVEESSTFAFGWW